MLACTPFLLITVSAMSASDLKGAFDAEKEKAVREVVYNNDPTTVSPNRNFHSVLVIPEPLTELYKSHPQSVIDVLLRIVDGGRPDDSSLAAGYALELLIGPGGGVVCVEHFDQKTYDSVDKDWKTTPRKHWMNKVRSKMKVETVAK